MAQERALKLENKQIGTYRLQTLVGKGQTSAVWRASHTLLNREVAIKLIPDPTGAIAERFKQEVPALEGLIHPNILPLVDYGVAEEQLYIVSPFVASGNLHNYLRAKTFTRTQAFETFNGLLKGLGFAHSKGVIHGNLKPSNVLLYPDGRPMITDFGLVHTTGMNENIALTLTGTLLGSPEYMAPEQFLGQADASSDLYSLALILFRMLTGHAPYQGSSAWELGMRQLNDPLPLPHPLIPASLENFFMKALDKRPAQRFGSAGEMKEAFRRSTENLLAEERLVHPTPQPAAMPAPPPVSVVPNADKTKPRPKQEAGYLPIGAVNFAPPVVPPMATRSLPALNQSALSKDSQAGPGQPSSQPSTPVLAQPKAKGKGKSPGSAPKPGRSRQVLLAIAISGWLVALGLAALLIVLLIQNGGVNLLTLNR